MTAVKDYPDQRFSRKFILQPITFVHLKKYIMNSIFEQKNILLKLKVYFKLETETKLPDGKDVHYTTRQNESPERLEDIRNVDRLVARIAVSLGIPVLKKMVSYRNHKSCP